jgi:alpha-1,3-rhamnosyltransferase
MKIEYPLVSVIVPAYNHEDYISDCIYSVLEQDYPRIELIVIDDGSSDNTDRIIKEILVKNPSRFLYVSKKNEGLIKTLNMGIKLSRGRYVCELASDDVLMPSSFMKRVAYLESHPDIDVVFADAYHIYDNVRTHDRLYEDREKFISRENTIRDLIEGKAKIFFPSGMFRKSVLERLGGFDEDFRYSEDVAMWYQLALRVRIGYIDEPVMYHRKHSDNTSSSFRFMAGVRKEKILALEKLLPLKIDGMGNDLKKYLFKEYVRFIRFALKNPVDGKELAEVSEKALQMHPHAIKIRYYMLLLKIKGYIRENGTKTV